MFVQGGNSGRITAVPKINGISASLERSEKLSLPIIEAAFPVRTDVCPLIISRL